MVATRKLLIAGSRDASLLLLFLARVIVDGHRHSGLTILVGDAAGIDQAVIEYCAQTRTPFECFGTRRLPRHWHKAGTNWGKYTVTPHVTTYRQRDRLMAELADIGEFLWNGRSTGTKCAYDYMARLGKPCRLWWEDSEGQLHVVEQV